jgi:hypothetical protein
MIKQTSLLMISYNHKFYKTYEHEIKSLITSNILQIHLAYANTYWCILAWFYSMKNFITKDENTLHGGPLWPVSQHVYKIYLCKRYYHNPSLGFVTKARACKVQVENVIWESHSHSWECERVWGNEPTHSQVDSHFRSWNPHGILNF